MGDPCGPPSDVSALCHVRTALSAIDPSWLPVRVHGTSCLSVYVTLGYRWLPSMRTWRCTYSPLRLKPQHICDIYNFFASHIDVLTYLLTYHRYVLLRGEGLVRWLWRWYVCVLHRGSNCSPSRAMDGRIMRHGIISSCQSAAEIVKRCCSSLVSSAIASTQTFTFYFLSAYNRPIGRKGMQSFICTSVYKLAACQNNPNFTK